MHASLWSALSVPALRHLRYAYTNVQYIFYDYCKSCINMPLCRHKYGTKELEVCYLLQYKRCVFFLPIYTIYLSWVRIIVLSMFKPTNRLTWSSVTLCIWQGSSQRVCFPRVYWFNSRSNRIWSNLANIHSTHLSPWRILFPSGSH